MIVSLKISASLVNVDFLFCCTGANRYIKVIYQWGGY
jgi:hypothetical protein